MGRIIPVILLLLISLCACEGNVQSGAPLPAESGFRADGPVVAESFTRAKSGLVYDLHSLGEYTDTEEFEPVFAEYIEMIADYMRDLGYYWEWTSTSVEADKSVATILYGAEGKAFSITVYPDGSQDVSVYGIALPYSEYADAVASLAHIVFSIDIDGDYLRDLVNTVQKEHYVSMTVYDPYDDVEVRIKPVGDDWQFEAFLTIT